MRPQGLKQHPTLVAYPQIASCILTLIVKKLQIKLVHQKPHQQTQEANPKSILNKKKTRKIDDIINDPSTSQVNWNHNTSSRKRGDLKMSAGDIIRS